jgi:hypothetical protein
VFVDCGAGVGDEGWGVCLKAWVFVWDGEVWECALDRLCEEGSWECYMLNVKQIEVRCR